MATIDGRDLLWGRRTPPTRGRPATLSTERIVAEATAVADAEGLAALSMKRLAEQLGSGVMSLYRHIPGKAELVALMLDNAFGEPPRTDSGDWRRDTRTLAMALRAMYHAHPWAVAASSETRPVGPRETAWLEAQLRALAPLGLSAGATMSTALAVSSYIRGAMQSEVPGHVPEFSHLEYADARERFPVVTATVLAPDFGEAAELRHYVEFGLDRLLDGIEAARSRA
ncbi:TetR family transcriptional regulator [Stackebrandtia albiflava]|uniref:TetR family transcriptional regulator n=1 Tax=Stackebrandtia albiflava TaxID=406432 RepID=A0A562V9Y0_9ACTN|nr:TetR/AcrR family transcriptional regulator C-terminal domain-containing protein [Stackebrandtia albiflava]TWJ14663.1 TetR family transcriptional regulator [Stackebrandtia albiflava]